ncbi:hypothetical protein [Scytonema sp. NUACC26]|uniref:hypothetical protein n=1 Tax=Scytonema sp. NUACC26 TaxID=3140176 RepID=UPI0034DC2E60
MPTILINRCQFVAQGLLSATEQENDSASGRIKAILEQLPLLSRLREKIIEANNRIRCYINKVPPGSPVPYRKETFLQDWIHRLRGLT